MVCPSTLPWEIFGEGELIQGYNNAFDGDGRLIVGGTPYSSQQRHLHDCQQRADHQYPAETLAGLTVNRQITVPSTGGQDFARTVDAFTNSTASRRLPPRRRSSATSAPTGPRRFPTSDGTGVVSPNDQWIGTDDASDRQRHAGRDPLHPRSRVAAYAGFRQPDRRQHRMDIQPYRAGGADGAAGLFHHRGHDPGGRRRSRQCLGDTVRVSEGRRAAFLESGGNLHRSAISFCCGRVYLGLPGYSDAQRISVVFEILRFAQDDKTAFRNRN